MAYAIEEFLFSTVRRLCSRESLFQSISLRFELGDFSIDSLTSALCEEYEVAAEQARADVEKMVAQWLELGIVE